MIVVVDEDKSFDKFFNENQYIDNPFGKDFIKLEVDLDRFDTNKTGKQHYSVLVISVLLRPF